MDNRAQHSADLRKFIVLFAPKLPAIEREASEIERWRAPNFSTIAAIRPNEVALSRLIANLLDPTGKHGQRDLFLSAFLRACGLQQFEYARVTLEEGTSNGRRIDIILETADTIVGIENKPWAADQDDQLDDYGLYLKAKAHRHKKKSALVYLSERSPPGVAHASVIHLPYASRPAMPSLEQAWKNVLPRIGAQRLREHVEELLAFLIGISAPNSVVSGTEMTSPYRDAVANELSAELSAENRKALVAVALSARRVRAELVKELENSIVAALRAVSSDVEICFKKGADLNSALEQQYGMMCARRPDWPANTHMCVSSEGGRWQAIGYGARALDGGSREALEYPNHVSVAHQMLRGLSATLAGRMPYPWWPWWDSSPEPNWTDDKVFEFALLSSTSRIEDHPGISSLITGMTGLFAAMDEILRRLRAPAVT